MEKYLIEHCSPTLASLKTANLFNYIFTSEEELYGYIRGLNRKLSAKGVSVTILRKEAHSALVYVYREKKLAEDLAKPGVREFLTKAGYEACTPCLLYTSPSRCSSCCCPLCCSEKGSRRRSWAAWRWPLWAVSLSADFWRWTPPLTGRCSVWPSGFWPPSAMRCTVSFLKLPRSGICLLYTSGQRQAGRRPLRMGVLRRCPGDIKGFPSGFCDVYKRQLMSMVM